MIYFAKISAARKMIRFPENFDISKIETISRKYRPLEKVHIWYYFTFIISLRSGVLLNSDWIRFLKCLNSFFLPSGVFFVWLRFELFWPWTIDVEVVTPDEVKLEVTADEFVFNSSVMLRSSFLSSRPTPVRFDGTKPPVFRVGWWGESFGILVFGVGVVFGVSFGISADGFWLDDNEPNRLEPAWAAGAETIDGFWLAGCFWPSFWPTNKSCG